MTDTTREAVALSCLPAHNGDGYSWGGDWILTVGDKSINLGPNNEALGRLILAALRPAQDAERTFTLGDRVSKVSGSKWTGRVVGFYSTALTPEGYAVESETEIGSVQIYPAKALRMLD